jgi:IS30 family transposase
MIDKCLLVTPQNIQGELIRNEIEQINLRAESVKEQKYNEILRKYKQLQNNWNELKKLIDERIGDCRYFLANADVNYEKENMKKFMWLKEELQILKSKAQELEQGKDE